MIPATPAKTGGAGTGNLNAAKTTPHPKPVNVDSIISFILTYSFGTSGNNAISLFVDSFMFFLFNSSMTSLIVACDISIYS